MSRSWGKATAKDTAALDSEYESIFGADKMPNERD